MEVELEADVEVELEAWGYGLWVWSFGFEGCSVLLCFALLCSSSALALLLGFKGLGFRV